MADYSGGYAGQSSYGKELVHAIKNGQTAGQRDRNLRQRIMLAAAQAAAMGISGGLKARESANAEKRRTMAKQSAWYDSAKSREAEAQAQSNQMKSDAAPRVDWSQQQTSLPEAQPQPMGQLPDAYMTPGGAMVAAKEGLGALSANAAAADADPSNPDFQLEAQANANDINTSKRLMGGGMMGTMSPMLRRPF